MTVEEMYREMESMGQQIIDSWMENQEDYGDAFVELGPKGQFSDVWRKIKKLQLAIWDGKKLNGEQPEQIIDETIHHLIMMKFLVQREGLSEASEIGSSLDFIDGVRQTLAAMKLMGKL
jgi:hypothetical protein